MQVFKTQIKLVSFKMSPINKIIILLPKIKWPVWWDCRQQNHLLLIPKYQYKKLRQGKKFREILSLFRRFSGGMYRLKIILMIIKEIGKIGWDLNKKMMKWTSKLKKDWNNKIRFYKVVSRTFSAFSRKDSWLLMQVHMKSLIKNNIKNLPLN